MLPTGCEKAPEDLRRSQRLPHSLMRLRSTFAASKDASGKEKAAEDLRHFQGLPHGARRPWSTCAASKDASRKEKGRKEGRQEGPAPIPRFPRLCGLPRLTGPVMRAQVFLPLCVGRSSSQYIKTHPYIRY